MEKEIGKITTLIGDPIRATILWTLLDGRAYTATELAVSADTSPQNISMHLTKLLKAELLSVQAQGRHRYFNLSGPEVAFAIEALGSLLPKDRHRKIITHTDNKAITYCRTCYDHLAGKIGVQITDAMVERRLIDLKETAYAVTASGHKFFSALDIPVEKLQQQRRIFARPCLDWSERRPHLAGSLGAAMLQRMLELNCVRRIKNSRALAVTSEGHSFLYDRLKIAQ